MDFVFHVIVIRPKEEIAVILNSDATLLNSRDQWVAVREFWNGVWFLFAEGNILQSVVTKV